jgi:hypothetical protein
MRIARRKGNHVDAGLRGELEEILCSGCTDKPVCGSGCLRPPPQECSRHCPDIPRALSSDPDNYPLEPRVAPLVYELKRLEVFEPCWSCEGHNHADGTLWKVPRVWFYCRSVVHLRVLADGLKELQLQGRLQVPWHIVVTFSDLDNAETTFSLEPCPGEARPVLGALQKDVETIAAHLHDQVFAEARKLSTSVE